MTEDYEKKLLESFPDLYITSSLGFPKFSGFECGNGWYDIIRELSEKINYEKLQQFGDESRELYATQVKEKYGTLRFYMNTETPEISDLINEYEEISGRTCETCGKAGKTRNTNWIRTLCDDHYRA
jgi:hypothetical protein